MSYKGSFFTGFLIGGLAGAVGALLMAPRSGENIRLQIQQKGGTVRSQIEGLAVDLQERGREMQQRGRQVIEEKLPIGGESGGETQTQIEDVSQSLLQEGEAALPGEQTETDRMLPPD